MIDFHRVEGRTGDAYPVDMEDALSPSNDQIAHALEEAADLLEAQQSNPFRVRAFRRAAQTVLESPDSISDLARNVGPAALKRLPGIGDGIAGVIDDYVRSGGGRLHYRDLDDSAAAQLLTLLPGIGDVLARRIVEALHVDTLEDLETAIYDGRLEQVEGFGARRTAALKQMINSMLSGRLQRRSRGLARRFRADLPPLDLLLRVDAEYRRRAAEGTLPMIAPRRLNPMRVAWLPILTVHDGGWKIRAMFSNTAQAHALERTRDWVVLIAQRAGDSHQCTVVTETRGPRAGQRVIRGR
jgi:DNA polymerase (family X)